MTSAFQPQFSTPRAAKSEAKVIQITPLVPHKPVRPPETQPVLQAPSKEPAKLKVEIPIWIRSIQKLEKISAIVALLLMGTTLTIYGWTTGEQAKWSESYKKLDSLRAQEQQLSVANELLKHELAEQAGQKDAGLEQPRLDNHIFLTPPPAPQGKTKKLKHHLNSVAKKPLITPKPLGY